MKKKHAKHIKSIAEQMGYRERTTYEWVPISGEDLILAGHKTFQGERINPSETYEMKFPVFHKESFEKSLKSEFNKNMESGLYAIVSTEYIARVNRGLIKHEEMQQK